MIRDKKNCDFCSGENEEPRGEDNWWKRRWKLNMMDYYYDGTMGDWDYDYRFLLESAKSDLSNHFHHPSHSDLRNQKNRSSLCTRQKFRLSPTVLRRDILKNISLVTFLNVLVIITAFLSGRVESFPTSDCDWIGSGTPENVVQAVYLRCQQGEIIWERPRGGLRVNISPPSYTFRSSFTSENQPFRLCLESNVGSNFQVFLEQQGSERDRKLLPFISPESSTCYRIDTPTATLYVESQNQHEEEKIRSTRSINSGTTSHKESYQVKISYEIEEYKSQAVSTDDECRPCSDQEVLQLYCVADVVAKGEILSVRPSITKKAMDNLHLKSTIVIHQNYPIFQSLKPGNKNLQKFLSQEVQVFAQDSPKKVSKSGKSSQFGGIVSHPTKCAAQSGPGEFLWLIKLSFGRPKIGCVVYWDKWVKLAQEATQSGSANCPLVYQ